MKTNQFLSKHKGFRQFLVKIGLLITIFLLLPIILYPFLEMSRYNNQINPDPLGNLFLVDIGNTVIFLIIAFILLARKKLFNLKEYLSNKPERLKFSLATIFFISVYLIVRYFTAHNTQIAFQYRVISISLILTSLALICLFLVLAIFTKKFIKEFLSNFKKELLISICLFLVYYCINYLIRSSWVFLGSIVTHSVAFLLSLSFKDVTLLFKGYNYNLGAHGFVASIGDLCSGIDSMALYLVLFAFILCLDWHILNKKRMVLIFLPGLLGLIAVNILRIYLLYILGILFSPEFAKGLFHSNAGWILFLGYFFIFWWFAYPWVKVKK